MRVAEFKQRLKEQLIEDINSLLKGDKRDAPRMEYLTKALERLKACETLGEMFEFLQNFVYYKISDVLVLMFLSIVEDKEKLNLEDLSKIPMVWEG